MSDNLVPEPRSTVFDAVNTAVGDEATAQKIMANPNLAAMTNQTHADATAEESAEHNHAEHGDHGEHADHACGCGKHDGSCCQDDKSAQDDIPLIAIDEIGRATAADVKEALHQVMDPELGIDVVDLGLVYGIEIDELSRAIITMTLTTPACPLTDLIEDECASALAGLVDEFRIDWTWTPRWTMDMITPEGRDQLAALGFNFDNMPRY